MVTRTGDEMEDVWMLLPDSRRSGPCCHGDGVAVPLSASTARMFQQALPGAPASLNCCPTPSLCLALAVLLSADKWLSFKEKLLRAL